MAPADRDPPTDVGSGTLPDDSAALVTVPTFFSRALEALAEARYADWRALFDRVAPWAGFVAEGIVGTLLPVHFARRLLERAVQPQDPDHLGRIACTIAFQRAVQQAVPEVLGSGPPPNRVYRKRLRAVAARTYDFAGFTLQDALSHPFARDATAALEAFAAAVPLHDDWPTRLCAEVHQRFVPNLRLLLTHGRTRDRFAAFRDLIALDAGGSVVQTVVQQHLELQRARFEYLPLLGREPFSLEEIYVEPDCTQLRWQEIQRGQHPFDAQQPSHNLQRTVEQLLSGPDYQGPILLQGPAGSGKSSFTLRLCATLARRGLKPLRIELRHLDARAHMRIEETVPQALQLLDSDGEVRFFTQAGRYQQDFLQLFDQRIAYRDCKLCPYILVLDGWDELPLAGNADFRSRLHAFLVDLQEALLARRTPYVRAMLVGRPSELLAASGILAPESVLVSVRPWDEAQLRRYYDRVAHVLAMRVGQKQRWNMPAAHILERLIALRSQGFDLLGSPLLAHLSLRLLGEDLSEQEAAHIVAELTEDPTSLHRRLTDLVIAKSGKDPDSDFSLRGSALLAGPALRGMLQRTAEAMRVLLRENISREALLMWLRVPDGELDARLTALEGEDRLSRLMVSFFFRGGHRSLGCEFSHKSFREYLFAERIVELLKQYGQTVAGREPPPRRAHYALDFAVDDPRAQLVNGLLSALGPSGLGAEEERHLGSLLRWEIRRAMRAVDPDAAADPTLILATPAASPAVWESIRDGLAAAWEHWTDGALLRWQAPQGERVASPPPGMPAVLAVAQSVRPPELGMVPMRIVTIDGHYGYALFRLVSWVHGFLLEETAGDFASAGEPLSRYQAIRSGRLVLRPSGDDPRWLGRGVHRVAALGYRFDGCQPLLDAAYLPAADLAGVVLTQASCRGAQLARADLTGADLKGAVLDQSNLTAALLCDADLRRARLDEAMLQDAQLQGGNLSGATLCGAELMKANLSGARLQAAVLTKANLEGAVLDGAVLDGARLERCAAAGAYFQHANLRGAALRGANLRGVAAAVADFGGADLREAYAWGACLRGANLEDATLVDADLRYADLRGANLRHANLQGANLSYARCQQADFGSAIAYGTRMRRQDVTGKQVRQFLGRGATIQWADDSG